ncbi:hypothetical protein KSS87_023772 [Heliosperma pusillum]|nr:hypothetical protein KSS87_023772 [Heliosperma pusillum]
MAYSCIPTTTIQSSTTLNTSIVNHHNLLSFSLPSRLLTQRVLRSNNVNEKIRRSLKVNAVYSDGFSTRRDEHDGIWSIREDLVPPSSPYFPVYAQGQGPPPMVAERFQSVITQLFQYRIIRCGGAVDDDMANIIVAQLLYLDAVDPTKDIVMYVNSPGGSVTAGMAIFDTMRHIRPDVSTVCVGLAASMGAFLLSAGTKGKRYSLPNSRIMIHQPLGGAQGGQTDIDIQVNAPSSGSDSFQYPNGTAEPLNPAPNEVASLITLLIKQITGSGTSGLRFKALQVQPCINSIGKALVLLCSYPAQMQTKLANEMLHHKANLNGYLAYHTGQSLQRINQDTDRDFFMSAKEAKDYGLIDGVIMNPLKALQPLAAATADQAS